MAPVSIEQAAKHLPELIDEAAAGHDVVIADNGEPVARIVPIPKKRPFVFGSMAGQIHVADDFDAPLPEEILMAFGDA